MQSAAASPPRRQRIFSLLTEPLFAHQTVGFHPEEPQVQ
jgi:hypothetical protein